ncbi:BnaC01g34870D [Brassica napus]|uniref:BnaC01g34870D protein n=1 Tax=Brassica napus TaxID=3708 RepID=A0A078HQI8_BRANA|nr:BnaC01g34870D [Brassica napus]
MEMSFDSFLSSSMFSSRLVHAITMKIDGGSCGISSDEGTMETMMNRGSRLAAWETLKEKRHTSEMDKGLAGSSKIRIKRHQSGLNMPRGKNIDCH